MFAAHSKQNYLMELKTVIREKSRVIRERNGITN